MTEPPLLHLQLYRLRSSPPAQPTSLRAEDGREISLLRGPFSLARGVHIPIHSDGGSGYTMGLEEHPIPEGAYLGFASPFAPFGTSPTHHDAILSNTEMAALTELHFPHLLAEKVFDDVPSTLTSVFIGGESPLRVIGRPPVPIHELTGALANSLEKLGRMDPQDRQRFRLASRWFRRGVEAPNDVDGFLYCYIALEVFPATGDVDVPARVRDFLHARLYQQHPPSTVKERLRLGQIAGLRARIVHDGLAFIGEGDQAFIELAACLQAIVRVCLRLHLTLSPGDDLDRWLAAV